MEFYFDARNEGPLRSKSRPRRPGKINVIYDASAKKNSSYFVMKYTLLVSSGASSNGSSGIPAEKIVVRAAATRMISTLGIKSIDELAEKPVDLIYSNDDLIGFSYDTIPSQNSESQQSSDDYRKPEYRRPAHKVAEIRVPRDFDTPSGANAFGSSKKKDSGAGAGKNSGAKSSGQSLEAIAASFGEGKNSVKGGKKSADAYIPSSSIPPKPVFSDYAVTVSGEKLILSATVLEELYKNRYLNPGTDYSPRFIQYCLNTVEKMRESTVGYFDQNSKAYRTIIFKPGFPFTQMTVHQDRIISCSVSARYEPTFFDLSDVEEPKKIEAEKDGIGIKRGVTKLHGVD